MLPLTEQTNPNSSEIDRVSVLEAVRLINAEDRFVAEAVGRALPEIAQSIEKIVDRLESGGRLFYVGAGSSGRLAVLDASEIPPTFGVSGDLIQGVIAGGYEALYKASEASEDDSARGGEDIIARGLTPRDAVVAVTASGSTPYTIGAAETAQRLGCFTACITCASDTAVAGAVQIPIVALVGPEVITGSTRMKAATAQKMILNMISTVAMIRLGFVSGNNMTNVNPASLKLKERSKRILEAETGLNDESARRLLNEAGGDLRVALVMFSANAERKIAEAALRNTNFAIEKAIESIN